MFIPQDLWLPNSHDLKPVDYQIWGVMQIHVYQTPVRDVADLKQCLIDTRCKALWMVLLMNGIGDFRSVWMKKNTLNNGCNI